jgi:hypothetical protein
VSGELNCALTTEQLPEAFPLAVGAKLAVNVKLLPGGRVNGSDAPLMPKPGPVAFAWEMIMATLPEFVTLKLWLLVDPTWTVPKLSAAGLMLTVPKVAAAGLAVPEGVALEFVVVAELPLALVTPAHPDRINNPDTIKLMKIRDKLGLAHLDRARQTHL